MKNIARLRAFVQSFTQLVEQAGQDEKRIFSDGKLIPSWCFVPKPSLSIFFCSLSLFLNLHHWSIPWRLVYDLLLIYDITSILCLSSISNVTCWFFLPTTAPSTLFFGYHTYFPFLLFPYNFHMVYCWSIPSFVYLRSVCIPWDSSLLIFRPQTISVDFPTSISILLSLPPIPSWFIHG